jgi:hypothetical protein
MAPAIGQSKLIQLISTFSSQEIKRYTLFVQSEYTNSNAQLKEMVAALTAKHPDYTTIKLEKTLLQGDTKRLNYLLSDLLSLAYRFLAYEEMTKTPSQEAFYTLKALSVRGLDKHYNLLYTRTLEQVQSDVRLDSPHYHALYQLENLNSEHIDKQGLRKVNESLQSAADHLDHFYLGEKLKYTCAMLNSQQVIAAPFAFRYIEELKQFFKHNPAPNSPVIAIYYRIFCMLTKVESEADFGQLKQLIKVYSHAFSQKEMTHIYGYALNYCIGKIRLVKEAYVQEALHLYRQGLDTGILLEEGKLSPWHFKNIIKLALRSQEYGWTEQFILEKNHLLEQGFRQDALHYNLAELYFYTKHYDKALTQLNKVEFTDINYNLGAKVMLVKIYQEQQELDALESLLHAFRLFLQRNRLISEQVRKAYLNFVRLANKIGKVRKSQIPTLRAEIEQMEPLTEKQWLLAQL